MPQTNSAQHSEQEITLKNLHEAFQQLCFSYGSLAITKESFSKEKYKWFANELRDLADIATAIHKANGGL